MKSSPAKNPTPWRAWRSRTPTPFILITDGITWMRRVNDLRKLIKLQNEGSISRIYTTKMVAQFEADLRELKREYSL